MKELSSSEIAFYATAAAVLPVLLLAFTIQLDPRRTVELWFGRASWVRVIVYLIIVLLVGAEVISMVALKDNSPGGDSKDWVMVAVFVGSAAVLLGILDSTMRGSRRSDAEPDRTETKQD